MGVTSELSMAMGKDGKLGTEEVLRPMSDLFPDYVQRVLSLLPETVLKENVKWPPKG